MKKKLLMYLLTLVCTICLCLGLAACGVDGADGKDGTDGTGISTVAIVDGDLVVTLTDGSDINCGAVVVSNGTNGTDGRGIASVTINESGNLIVTYTDDTSDDLGKVTGAEGAAGAGVKTATIDENGVLVITLTTGTDIYCGVVVGADGNDGDSVTSATIDADGNLVLTFKNSDPVTVGNVVGAKGDDGVGIEKIEINTDNELVITLTDGTPCNLGNVKGTDGNDGVGIEKVEIDGQGQVIVTYTNNDSKTVGTIYCTHSYGEWVIGKEATCTSIGYKTRTCSICGDVDYQFIEAAGHTAESYTYDNTYHYYYCTECGLYLREAHIFKNYTCTACEYEVDFGLEYTLSDDESSYSVTGIGTCTDTDIVIPSKYNGLPVTTIESAFKDNTTLTSVIIGGNVTTISGGAFSGCTALESITIGEKVTTLGNNVFKNCTALTQIYLNATAMNDLIFRNCVFPYAGQNGTGITVTIGANVTKIPDYLFYPEIITSADTIYTPTIKNVVFEENGVCKSIGDYAFCYCDTLESINIPGSVETIGDNAFTGCTALTSVTIPDGVTTISNSTFANCTSLASIVIGSGVTSVGEAAFYNCTALTVYYNGTAEQWNKITIDDTNGYDTCLTGATRYYYSEAEPTESGNYWHYVNGEIVIWTDSTASE